MNEAKDAPEAMEERTLGQIVLGWWQRVLADRQSGRARALAARLRRASPVAALAEPEVHDLARRLGLRDAAHLARLVTLLAEVRTHVPQTLMRRLGGPEPVLSPLRFQRLMRASDEELPDALRRAIVAADRTCNVAALGEDLLFWSEKSRGRWSFQYFWADTPASLSGGGPANGDPSKETSE
jgi:CRISPR system Cascade subunit CasB